MAILTHNMDWRLTTIASGIEPSRAVQLQQQLDHAHPFSVFLVSRLQPMWILLEGVHVIRNLNRMVLQIDVRKPDLIDCGGAKFIGVKSVGTHFTQRSHRLFAAFLHCSAGREQSRSVRRVGAAWMMCGQ